MKLYIKNMVCSRCTYIVQQELNRLNIPVQQVTLGEVELRQELSLHQTEQLSAALQQFGFELMDDRKSRIIEKIKHLVIDHVKEFKTLRINFSEFLSNELHHDYTYLSNLFSSVEGTTIEKFIIETKIEKVKELLVYDELSLTEIADKLGYSSVAHLSNQFKKTTGLSPSHFKNLTSHKRTPLDEL